MARDIPIGNGNVLIAFDKHGLLRELFYPHVGEENHVKGEFFRFGIWTDGQFSWVGDGWKIERDYVENSLVAAITMTHGDFPLQITSHDFVDLNENIYFKKIIVKNLGSEEKNTTLFLGQDFHIYGSEIGNTAAFRPEANCLIHYKHERYFLINVRANNKYGIDQFATGNDGTWQDAEDGQLSGNPIAQGNVDSVIGIPLTVAAQGEETFFYWIAMGRNWEEVKALNEQIKKKTPEEFLRSTKDYWNLWIMKERINEGALSPKIQHLYRRSLIICQTHINQNGSIIAGSDSDLVYFNRDTYNYMWPRDGSFVAYALDLAGYETRHFYRFCADVITKEGYFLHKYTPSGSWGSSWHPWVQGNKTQLPIQEDETALVIWALWHHYQKHRDLEFIQPLYGKLIKPASDFLMSYRDFNTNLPLSSFDLWEERQGILTFTTATVYGALIAAAQFAEMFGENSLADEYREGAKQMKEAMEKYLYLKDKKRFARMIRKRDDGSFEIDDTIDASLYAVFAFGVYPPDHSYVQSTMEQVQSALSINDTGIIRYENDSFFRDQGQKSNPWFITTLWVAQYYIARAKQKEDLAKAKDILEWVADRALPSGVLGEQVNPETQEFVSVSPLIWSHGTYVATVQEYLHKAKAIQL